MDTHIEKLSRRAAVGRVGLLAGATLAAKFTSVGEAASAEPAAPVAVPGGSFLFSLNTATIRGQRLGIEKEVEVAAQAGYQAIEPWTESLEAYKKKGGSLADLKKKIADLGLVVPSAIGFPQWIVDDDEQRAKGLERAKLEMSWVAEIGGLRLAAPPAGATDRPGLQFGAAAERYKALLEAGAEIGVLPQLELWGFSKNLSKLGECACVAIETGRPEACVLLDVFHLYKGGTEPGGIRLMNGNAVHVLHMNDYPADPPRAKINDGARVFPGDGTAPIVEILRSLRAIGGEKALSLELFNRKYYAMDALEVARDGLAKMKAAVETAKG